MLQCFEVSASMSFQNGKLTTKMVDLTPPGRTNTCLLFTEERAAKVQSLTASYNRSCTTIVWSCTAQERAAATSLRVNNFHYFIMCIFNLPLSDVTTFKRKNNDKL